MKKLQRIFFAVAGILILATSCNVNDSSSNPQQGSFLLANISPDALPLNVNINNSPFGSGLSYPNHTPYYSTTAGSYQFSFYGTGTTPVLTSTVNIEVAKYYSYFVIDSFSTLKSSFVQDNLIIPGVDSVYVRFFNFSPNSGALNLYDSVNKINLSSNRTFNDQANNASYANFTLGKAGIYTLQLKQPDGTLLVSQVDTLASGHVYSIYAKGFLGGAGPQAIGIGQIIHL